MLSKNQEIIGGANNFWLYSKTDEFDLTHLATSDFFIIYSRLSLKTTTAQIAIDFKKTALVIVDLQNYFLSSSLKRPTDAIGLKVVDNFLQHALSACRMAQIPIM